MSETRMHDPDDDEGLGHLVRQALGDAVRPVQPGGRTPPGEGGEDDGHQQADDDDRNEPPALDLPEWGTDGPVLHF